MHQWPRSARPCPIAGFPSQSLVSVGADPPPPARDPPVRRTRPPGHCGHARLGGHPTLSRCSPGAVPRRVFAAPAARFGQLFVVTGQDTLCRLDHRHLGSQLAVRNAQARPMYPAPACKRLGRTSGDKASVDDHSAPPKGMAGRLPRVLNLWPAANVNECAGWVNYRLERAQ